ncbi:uncharacterized protein LOC121267261 [Juglans microcarpa x Juglans regia]|uniref:uncharacterized protein LOC121267261 n=1 Tax=Juglans microcarpa x Juglans regia TaxID=2249226 RepID=UPI001B7E0226|nr:uncharacterized protein LOC121267261 [Juglans microcarpa x Juglans regia]
MEEKCLLAASLAALACHPSTTIKCFKSSSTISPQKVKPKPPSLKKVPSKSKKKLDPHEKPSPSATLNLQRRLISPSRTDHKLSEAVFSEVVEGDPSLGIVKTIFRSGWPKDIGLKIHKVLKVNHSASFLSKFEEYRKKVKLNAANSCHSTKTLMERLIADGNELLRFQSALITCSLGTISGYSRLCDKKCCGICRQMISFRFGVEDGPPISVHGSSWKAHEKVSRECITKRVSCARKAIVLCRVIAGRTDVARHHMHGKEVRSNSAVTGSTGDQSKYGSEELLVLNPRAVLPCFVVLYI